MCHGSETCQAAGRSNDSNAGCVRHRHKFPTSGICVPSMPPHMLPITQLVEAMQALQSVITALRGLRQQIACSICTLRSPRSTSEILKRSDGSSQVDATMEAAQRVVTALRGLRQQYGLQKQRPAVSLAVSQPGAADGLEAAAPSIATLSLSSAVTILRVGTLTATARCPGTGQAIAPELSGLGLLSVAPVCCC